MEDHDLGDVYRGEKMTLDYTSIDYTLTINTGDITYIGIS
jgi:hypothetical protein